VGLDVHLTIDTYAGINGKERLSLYDANITHNLTDMAAAAGIYKACWRPEEIGAKKAGEIIEILENGLDDMKHWPDFFKQFDSPNGWGTYEHFVPWVSDYLDACKRHPRADISVSR